MTSWSALPPSCSTPEPTPPETSWPPPCKLLCAHPDQWALLAEHPELAPQAVDELIRHSPIIFAVTRVAAEDVELGGIALSGGTYVVANTASANRDPAVYDDPDHLDITRQAPPALTTFGGGVHYCLGAHLARVELREALRVITRRMPNARRTGPAPWRLPTELSGPTTLPIEFDASTEPILLGDHPSYCISPGSAAAHTTATQQTIHSSRHVPQTPA